MAEEEGERGDDAAELARQDGVATAVGARDIGDVRSIPVSFPQGDEIMMTRYKMRLRIPGP